MADIQLLSAARAHRDLSHQIAAWRWLQEQLQQRPEILAEFAELFRADPPDKPPTTQKQTSVHLNVPHEYQLDNGPTGWRECFSSSCAMVARYFGAINSDTQYNIIRSRYGDTTSASAQVQALRSLGLEASFCQDGSPETLERLLRNGQPVPVGWLHKGHVSHPSGGGHWSVVIGMDSKAFFHNDPNGEADLVRGNYVSRTASAGKNIRYSRTNWLPRWLAGDSPGWYLNVSKA